MKNNYEDSHPDDAQLLLALDGELDAGAAAAISQHAENCPVCRAQWEQWKRISARIVEYHNGALQARVPPVSTPLPLMEARTRRNPARVRVIAALTGAAAALVCLVWIVGRTDRPAAVPQHPTPLTPVVVTPPPALPEAPTPLKRLRPHSRPEGTVAVDNPGFFALPFSDGALPLRDATVVRVQLPIEELRLTGLAVEGQNPGATIQADVLLGIDGLPRGIRLVQ